MATIEKIDIDAAEAYLADIETAYLNESQLVVGVEKLEFQGFNPKVFLAHLHSIARSKKVPEDVHRKNLKTLSVFGTMRGSKANKIATKSAPDTKIRLEKMIALYNIKSTKPQTKTDVTLIRIVACYTATIALGIFSGMSIKTTIKPESIHAGYPPAMCISTFGSIIPDGELSGDEIEVLFKAFCYHQLLFDRVINPNAHTNRQVISNFEAYIQQEPDFVRKWADHLSPAT